MAAISKPDSWLAVVYLLENQSFWIIQINLAPGCCNESGCYVMQEVSQINIFLQNYNEFILFMGCYHKQIVGGGTGTLTRVPTRGADIRPPPGGFS